MVAGIVQLGPARTRKVHRDLDHRPERQVRQCRALAAQIRSETDRMR